MEPDKNEGWVWTKWEDLEAMAVRQKQSEELFVPLYNFIVDYPELGREIKSQAPA